MRIDLTAQRYSSGPPPGVGDLWLCSSPQRQYDAAGPPSRKLWHLSLVVSGGVDSGKWRRNVYDTKPQRYAEDNRTEHLTARSDKSVAYVTNNKRLRSTFCTVEANYWQTRSIARPLCDSTATCNMMRLSS